MRRSILSLLMLVASVAGAFAATTSGGPEMTKQEAVSRLKTYMDASPFGHDALQKGVNDIAASGNADASTVSAIYAAAVAGADVELNENLYRVRVTIANVGVNKGNTGSPKLLGSEAEENSTCGFQLKDEVANTSIWRFNIAKDGKYTIACNVGQYIGYKDDPFVPGESKTVDVCLQTMFDYMYRFNVAYAENGKGVTFDIDGKYLAMDENCTFSFVDEVTDNAIWKLSRAYDESLDLPVFSTKENPVYYTLENQAKGLLSIENEKYINCMALNDYSYWYLVDAGEEIGTFRLFNKKDNYGIAYTTANGKMKPQKDYESNSMLFFMLQGNEANGWSISCKPWDHLTNYNYETIHAMMYDYGSDWVCGGAPRDNRNNIALFTWKAEKAGNDASVEEFINLKTNMLLVFKNLRGSSPWGTTLLNNTISDLEKTDISQYESPTQAIEGITAKGEAALNAYHTQINKEARGYNVKISNVRRRFHDNVGELGHYLTTVGEGDALTVNTVNQLERNPGFWHIEGVEGNDMAFRLRNQNGVYLCEVANSATVATTTDAASAGLYTLLSYDGYLRIVNANLQGAGLNVDTNGNGLVGYDYKDDGSTWCFESVALYEHIEGMPKLSTESDIYLYTIRSATDENDYLEFDADGQGLVHLPKSSLSYCYFLPANDGSDGVQIISYDHRTRLSYSPYSNYFYSRAQGWETDPNFNWYIVPNGPEGTESFAISFRYPVNGNTCISKKSNDPIRPHFNSCGSMEDWENTGWVFVAEEKVNHEEIFNKSRMILLDEAVSYQKAIPWAAQSLEELRSTLENAQMTDFGTETPAAVNNMRNFYSGKLISIEEELEIEPRDAWVSISNVRRLGSAESGAYLTAKDGYLNTADELTESGKWMLKYFSNGRYFLVNADGLYMGDLSNRVTVTENEAEAGKYSLTLLNGYLSLVDRANPDNRALNIDPDQSDACVYAAGDAGSRWIARLTTPAGIDYIEADTDNTAVVYYNLTGVKVEKTNLTPGIYLRDNGTNVTKVLVK